MGAGAPGGHISMAGGHIAMRPDGVGEGVTSIRYQI